MLGYDQTERQGAQLHAFLQDPNLVHAFFTVMNKINIKA